MTNGSPQVRLSVGADPQCRWHVTGQGVAPLHFELYWDGAALWAADSAGAGSVNIDGVTLGDWTQITGRVRIAFGRAAMIVETSLAADVSVLAGGGADDDDDLPREGAVVLRGPISDRDTRSTLPDPGSAPSLADGATHLLASPPDFSGLPPDDTGPLERWPGEPARRAAPGPVVAAVGDGAAGRGQRPAAASARPARAAEPDTRIAGPSGRAATPQGASKPSARAAPTPPAAPSAVDPAATRLVSSPAPVARAAAGAGAPPAGVLARPRLGQEPPPAFHDRPTVIVPSADDAGGLPDFPTEPSEPDMHLRATHSPPGLASAPLMTPTHQAHGPMPGTLPAAATAAGASVVGLSSASEVTPFAQPPSDTGMRASPVVKAENPSKKKMAMPLRTWLLFAAVVVAAAAALLFDEDETPAATPRPATVAQQTSGRSPSAGQAVGPAGAQTAVVPAQGMTPTGPTRAVQVAQIATPVPTSVPGAPGAEPDTTDAADPVAPTGVPDVAPAPAPVAANAATPESEAADLLITGHHREALARYERLAAERPETATFAAFAKILRRRLAAQCRDGYGPGGEPCGTP